jgi:GGDEF domain-containing protein
MDSIAFATQAISQIKRDVDVFGHVGDKAFGLILPGVGTKQSHALVDRIVADLPKLAPKLGGYWPILHFGIAGVPDDARDLSTLFRASQIAMIEAASKNYTRIRFADMH